MATQVKVGKRRDLTAMTDAYNAGNRVSKLAERAINELERMREATGRPSYERIYPILGELGLQAAKLTTNLEEMKTIRKLASSNLPSPLSNDLFDLAERLAAVEAGLVEMQVHFGVSA